MINPLIKAMFFITVGLSMWSCGPPSIKVKYEPGKRINVRVLDDDGNTVDGARIIMSRKDYFPLEKTVNKNGLATFDEIFKLPFNLEVQHTEEYNFITRLVTKDDFSNGKRLVEIPIELERKKTTILGRVVDKETGKPIGELVRIDTYPVIIIEKTKVDGTYRISSTDFDEGDLIKVSATLEGYEDDHTTVTIKNYWGENVVPEISIKRLPGSTIDIDTESEIIIDNDGTVTFD